MNEYESNSIEGATPEEPTGRSKLPQWLRSKRNRWIASSALIVAIIGSSVGVATSSSSAPPAASASASTASSTAAGQAFKAGFGSNGGKSPARSAPAPGGTIGTIDSVSASSFTLTTPAGQKVTVNESASTTYQNGSSSTSTSVVQTGANVLVLGTVNSTTIAATDVSVEATPTSEPASASTVIPFTQGKPSAETKVGTIPANWSAGQGTLVTGSAANEATEAALAAYPGGVVDRVVVLSDGDYNVHFIGVNWPHHVFLNSSFNVIGAE
ncbi:MAG TPA: DUF5666 domain-containing protein [Acidimicrobiales bacterium]|nr:DUF5666 domain-containing protein [Acidimicrobiales bacterium]